MSSEIICHIYDTEYITDNNEGLHLWCLDRESKPIHILIKKCPIYMYIELPKTPGIKWDSDSVDMLYEDFKDVLGRNAPIIMEFTERIKLYYHSEVRIPMARLFFKSKSQMYFACKSLRKSNEYNNFGTMVFQTFEEDISIRRKIFTLRKTRYCQWFRLSNAKEIMLNDNSRMATAGVVGREIREFISYDYNNINPISSEESRGWVTKPRILSFDIETYTDNHNSLPDSTHPLHVIYMISCLYQETGNKDSRQKFVIVSEECKDIPGSTIIKADDEEDLLVKFLELIDDLDPEILMGYNIFSYDYPYIDSRYKRYRENYEPCSRLLNYIPDISSMTWNSDAYGDVVICHLKMPGRISIDMLPYIKRDYKLDKYSLDFVSNYFLQAKKHPVTAKQMFLAYESKDINEMTKVTDYCIQDSNLVIDLYEKMNVWISLVEMANIVGVEIMEIFTRGQQIRCLSQIYNLTHYLKIVLNKRTYIAIDFKGGFVGEQTVGIRKMVLVVDFSSLYPSIMRAYNICYTTLIPEIRIDMYDPKDYHTIEILDDDGNIVSKYYFVKAEIKRGVLPQLVENLVNERNNVRKEQKSIESKMKLIKNEISEDKSIGKNVEDKIKKYTSLELDWTVLEKRQLGLKVSANSMYGFLGTSEKGKLPLPEGAVSITSKGRQLITEVNNFLIEKFNATVVYNDTDSSMVTVPALKDQKETNKWGHFLAEQISGKDAVIDDSGNIVEPEVQGLFPPPLKMEFEKGMQYIGIAKKKYAGLIIQDDGSYKRKADGSLDIYKRGIVIARRDNFPYLRKVYTKLLESCLLEKPIEESFKIIVDAVKTVLSGDLPARGNYTIIRGVSKEYKSDSYFMKVFSDELARRGNPVSPGDRLEYVIVKGDPSLLIGQRMRLIDMYETSLNYDEEVNGPRPHNIYPKEEIDKLYYLTNGLQNPIDQLFSAGYKEQLYGTTLYDFKYTPVNCKRRPVSIITPIKMLTLMMYDMTVKDNFTLDDVLNYLENEFYDLFLEELHNSKKLDHEHELETFDEFVEDDDEELVEL